MVVVLIALILSAELGVRAAAPHIPQPLVWGDYEAQFKLARMTDLRRRSDRASVVFVGSSNMNYAVDPPLFARRAGLQAPIFNAALNGADLRSIAFWTIRVVVPTLHPDVVVLGTTSREFNELNTPGILFYQQVTQSPAARKLLGADTTLDHLEASLERYSYLARYRTTLRRPVDLIKGNAVESEQRVNRWGTYLNLRFFQSRPYSVPPRFRRPLRFAIGGPQVSALDRLADELSRRGIRLVVVKMPVTKDFHLLPTHLQAYREYEHTLERFVRSHAVGYVDASKPIRDRELFVDPIHLNTAGMRRFTTLVAAQVRNGTGRRPGR